MLKHYRRHLSMTVSFVFLINLAACFQSSPPKELALEYPLPPGELWSEAATWEVTPRKGSVVEIPAGKTVVLDIDTPELSGLMIKGNLVFAHGNIELTSAWIAVKGSLQVGSPNKPFTRQATITLTGKPGAQTPLSSGMGNKVLAVQGGTLELYGQPKLSWTRLSKTAKVGDSELILETTVDWQPGDHIVIASTDFDYQQAEERIVKSVEGKKVSLELSSRGKDAHLKGGLEYEHWGEKETFDGHTIDERAEVGLLSRNILIRGDDASLEAGFGAHMMAMKGSKVHISGVEFHRMGQRGELGRYPVHWHLAGEAAGNFIEHSSIHRSFNRCLTIHGTHGIRIEANVAYNAVGHCYFLEDGIERGNIFSENLGLVVHRPKSGEELLISEREVRGPAVYWITNPDNTFRNNVAAGSQGTGFWIALPEHPTGPSATGTLWPRRTALKEFVGNVSHSNGLNGLHFDNGPMSDSSETESVHYQPRFDPSNKNSELIETVIDNFTAYKNRNRGLWIRGEKLRVRRSSFSDNAIGATLAYREIGSVFEYEKNYVQDSVFIGESANKGTPRVGEEVGLDGRTLPRPTSCTVEETCKDFTIRGFEFYDGVMGIQNSYFGGFESNAQRHAAALSLLEYSDFSMSSNNFTEDLAFAEGTNRVYFETRPVPNIPEHGTEDGYRSAVIFDKDGSVTGLDSSYVVVDNPFILSDNCLKNEAWNAWVCTGTRYVALIVNIGEKTRKISLNRPDGRAHILYGISKQPSNVFRSLLTDRDTYTLAFETLPQVLGLLLHEGSETWLRLKIPYQGAIPQITKRGRIVLPVDNLDQLALLAESGYFYDEDSSVLHLKLFALTSREALTVSRLEATPAGHP